MKILITGNMGYIGPTLTRHLRTTHPDAVLVGFDIGYFGNCVTSSDMLPECRVHLQYFGDIRQFPKEVLRDIDAVIHLAGISNDPIGNKFEEVTLDINYRASIDLAKMAKEAGVKSFVFASSCSMYGAADDRARTEKSTLNPLTAYAKSKALTEKDLEPLASDLFKITCLRFATACGWTDRLRLDLVLNDFVAGAITSKNITILSDGTPWRPLINVKDMVRAMEWAINREITNGGNFLAVNVGSDQWNYQVKDLAEAVAKVIPGTDVSINKNAQPDKRSYKVNFDLFKNIAPKHQPQSGLTDTILELKNGLESLKFNDKEFRNSRYMRLNVLTELQEKNLLDNKFQWVR